MPDLIDQLLPELTTRKYPDLDLGDDLVLPAYDGLSILNLPGTICRFYDIPWTGAEPLAVDMLDGLKEPAGVSTVILVLIDALSLQQFRRWIHAGELPLWKQLAQDGVLIPGTSITPSTTSAALTTLWTGRSAKEHGIVGYELWLKEYGLVANMISHSPFAFSGAPGALHHAGFDPEAFLTGLTLGPHLSVHGVKPYAFQHQSIANSGLSRMLLRDVEVHAFHTPVDLWISLRELLNTDTGQRRYIWVYWGALDVYAHLFGPHDERTMAEFKYFTMGLEQLLLSELSKTPRQKPLLVLAADHGQIHTPKVPHYDLQNHQGLTRRLHMQPTGENRLIHLFVRPGQMEAVREYIDRTWPGAFAILDPFYAVEAGLFGPGKAHPRLLERLGDLLVVARRDAYLWWARTENPILGRHGGLSPDEMLVPILAVRL